MLPVTPTTTTRPARLPATALGAAAQSFRFEPPGEDEERIDDLLCAPAAGVHDDVVAAEIGEVDLIRVAIAPALAVFARAQILDRLRLRHPVSGGHPRAAHPERRAHPDAQVAVDQPAAQPAVHQHPAPAGDLHLHRVEGPVDRLVPLRQAPQRLERQAAPIGLLTKHFPRRKVPEVQGARQRFGDRALAGTDLPAHRDDHSDSTASAGSSSSSSASPLLVKRWATVSGWTAERTTCPLSVMTTARVRRP